MTWATAHAGERAATCAADVDRHFAPGEAALARIGEGHDRVEVRARDRAEREDQRDEPRARRERVGEQRDRDVPAARARSPMMPEPTTVASSSAVPTASAASFLNSIRGALAVLAAVLPGEVGQRSQRLVVRALWWNANFPSRRVATRPPSTRRSRWWLSVVQGGMSSLAWRSVRWWCPRVQPGRPRAGSRDAPGARAPPAARRGVPVFRSRSTSRLFEVSAQAPRGPPSRGQAEPCFFIRCPIWSRVARLVIGES